MTTQEAFDRVWDWFVVQGKGPSITPTRSTDGGITCMYRSLDGFKCALGVLIPDSEYRHDMEYKTVEEIRAEGILPLSLDGLPDSFLKRLQDCHDKAAVEVNLSRFSDRTDASSFTDTVRSLLVLVGRDAGLVVPENGGSK